MEHYPYLIVGGGMTGFAAIQGIREVDEKSPIGLFGRENHPPYRRPLLSKGLWTGKPFEKVWMQGTDAGVTFHLGREIRSLDVQKKQVVDDRGEAFGYDQLLLATGAQPRKFPYGEGKIIYFRTLDDYQNLHGMIGLGRHFVVIGGGFIGSEIAAALAMNGEQVTMIFPEHGIGARLFPEDLSIYLNDYYRQHGVDVRPGLAITDLFQDGDQLMIQINDGVHLQADQVVAGIGVIPSNELVEAAGISFDNGIVVDEYLRTNQVDVFAAGDAASFHNPALGSRLRVEHEDNALTMGKVAGKNMALLKKSGQPVPYTHLPYFYSDLFDLGYEAVGTLDSRLETYSDWQEPFRKGVVYYLNEGRVRGVLLWDVWKKVDAARKLISEAGPFDSERLNRSGIQVL